MLLPSYFPIAPSGGGRGRPCPARRGFKSGCVRTGEFQTQGPNGLPGTACEMPAESLTRGKTELTMHGWTLPRTPFRLLSGATAGFGTSGLFVSALLTHGDSWRPYPTSHQSHSPCRKYKRIGPYSMRYLGEHQPPTPSSSAGRGPQEIGSHPSAFRRIIRLGDNSSRS